MEDYTPNHSSDIISALNDLHGPNSTQDIGTYMARMESTMDTIDPPAAPQPKPKRKSNATRTVLRPSQS